MRRVLVALAVAACGNGKAPGPSSTPAPVISAPGTAPIASPAAGGALVVQPGLPQHAIRRLGSEAFRHPSGFGVQATPDGARMLSRSQGGELRTWDVATGQLLGRFDTFLGGLLLPDGKRIITDKGVQSPTGEILAESPKGYHGAVGSKLLVLVDKPDVNILDATTLAKLGSFTVRGDIRRVALAPDGSAIAIATGASVTTYKLPAGGAGKVVRFDGDVSHLTFVGPRRIAASMDLDRVVVHDLGNDKRVLDWKGTAEIVIVTGLAGIRNGKQLVVSINGSPSQLLELETGKAIPLATWPGVGIEPVELANGIVAVQTTDSIRMFELATGKPVHVPDGHRETVSGLAFDGSALLSASHDGQLLRWNLGTGRVERSRAFDLGVDAIALAPDHEHVAIAGHRLPGLVDAKTLEVEKHGSHSNDVAWSGGKAIDGSDVRDIDCGMMICQLATSATAAIAIGDDNGQKLVIAESVAAAGTAKRIDVCGYLRGLDRSNDRVAFTGDSCGQLHDTKGALIAALERTGTRPRSVAFSADGKWLATGWEDGAVEIRDASTGAVRTTLTGHRDGVTAVAFSADGKLLASGSEDGTILIWNAW